MRSPQNAPVLITGAGRGIGKRIAIGFAHAGSPVGLLGRSQAELDVTKLEIEQAGGTAVRLRADVTDFEQVSAAVDKMVRTLGEVYAVVTNAAVQGPIGPFVENRPRDWRDVFQTNVIGVMNCCRAVLPQMIQRRNGKLVVIVAAGAADPRPNFAAYASSKAAVVRFAESLAEEIREQNVQINCMFPGGSYTSMTDEILHAGHKAGIQEVEDAERIRLTGGTGPDKQTQLALFLASERSNHITGKLIYVQDDWKKLERENGRPDSFTLRRHLK